MKKYLRLSKENTLMVWSKVLFKSPTMLSGLVEGLWGLCSCNRDEQTPDRAHTQYSNKFQVAC